MPSRANYGIDSPGIVAGLVFLGGICAGAGLLIHRFASGHPFWAIGLLAAGTYFLLGAAGMFGYSKVFKLQIRDHVIESIAWRGDEIVLDVGCGRGLLLVAAARRLATGKAIGLDCWLSGALTGNRPESALGNARVEGVSDCVQLAQGDVRHLPFADGSFDVVVSNFVIHEVNNQAQREKLLREIARVLRPGGRLALVDFIFTAEAVRILRAIGIRDAMRSRVGSFFSFWLTAILNFGVAQTYLVVGTKPAVSAAPDDET